MLGKTFVLLALLATPAVASAQISVPTPTESESNFLRDRNTSVTERALSDYTPPGIRAGVFRVSPSLNLASEWNDNIYYTDQNKESDRSWRVNPGILVQSDWSRHSLGFNASGDFTRYDDFKSENTDNYTVGANGQLDISRQTNATLAASTSKRTEGRGSANAISTAASPPEYTVDSVTAGLNHEFNRLKVAGRYDWRKYNYKDIDLVGGGVADQTARDYKQQVFTGRADYALSPATAVFGSVALTSKDYRTITGGQPPRSSDGSTILVGANFDITNLIRGEFAIGYANQNFDNSTYKDLNGVAVRGLVEWFPSQLMTVTFTANHALEDAAAVGVGGYDTSDFGLRADYELRRNWLLNAHGDVGKDNFQGGSRTDKRSGAGFGATYLMNRRVGLALDYDYAKRDSRGSQAASSYAANKLTAALVLKF